jgi:KUP system potassium uptake protein
MSRDAASAGALNPLIGVNSVEHGWSAFVALGAIVLAVTGAEALYADMGHSTTAHPRRLVQPCVPALAVNYLGQARC